MEVDFVTAAEAEGTILAAFDAHLAKTTFTFALPLAFTGYSKSAVLSTFANDDRSLGDTLVGNDGDCGGLSGYHPGGV